jgi:glycosyltransferase involved in cell wall biosynthesis
LAAALLDLLNDGAKARMMGAAGQVKAANEYSAGKMADKMLKIYRSAAGSKVG